MGDTTGGSKLESLQTQRRSLDGAPAEGTGREGHLQDGRDTVLMKNVAALDGAGAVRGQRL